VNLPEGLTEAEFVRTLNDTVDVLSHSFVFGFYDLDDIKQQARVFGIEAMPRYNPNRPLENFLYTHIRNRLINLRRDKYRRTDPPCQLCHTGRQADHPGGEICEKYRKWRKRNAAKSNLMRPLDIDHIADEHERNMRTSSGVEDAAGFAEMKAKINAQLSVELRSTYLKILAGKSVTKTMKAQVETAIREILGCQKTNADD